MSTNNKKSKIYLRFKNNNNFTIVSDMSPLSFAAKISKIPHVNRCSFKDIFNVPLPNRNKKLKLSRWHARALTRSTVWRPTLMTTRL